MAQPRWVLVDDTDSGFTYSSGWSLVSGSNWDKQGNFGPTYLNSLHSTTASEASFTYTYTGSRGRVYGTTNVNVNTGDPSWECFVDGTKIPTGNPFQYTENNWVLCSWDNVADGRHTMQVVAKSQGRAFLFDHFEYVPSPSTNIQNAVISTSFSDPAIQYSSGWGTLGDIARHAGGAGAVATIPFYGTGVKWMGYIPIELPKDPSTAEYSIDGGPVTTFTVPGSFGGTSQYWQNVFQVGGLALGSHTLRVTSRGQTSQTPLVLCFLLVEGSSSQPPTVAPPASPTVDNGPTSITTNHGTSVGTTTTPGGSQQTITTFVNGSATIIQVNASSSSGASIVGTGSGASGNSNTGNSDTGNGSNGSSDSSKASGDNTSGQTASSGSNETPIGAIVGGVVGALALIALIVFAVLFYRRRTKKQREAGASEQVEPFYRDVPSPRSAPLTSLDVQSEYSGGWNHQMSQTGNNRAVYPSKAGALSPTRDPTYPNTRPTLYPNRRSAAAEAEAGDLYPSGSSEASVPTSISSTGSAAPLRPNRGVSKYQEARSETPQASGSNVRIVNHEDSGIRMARASVAPTQVIEFPPSYSAS